MSWGDLDLDLDLDDKNGPGAPKIPRANPPAPYR
jgi:hypothetical protein